MSNQHEYSQQQDDELLDQCQISRSWQRPSQPFYWPASHHSPKVQSPLDQHQQSHHHQDHMNLLIHKVINYMCMINMRWYFRITSGFCSSNKLTEYNQHFPKKRKYKFLSVWTSAQEILQLERDGHSLEPMYWAHPLQSSMHDHPMASICQECQKEHQDLQRNNCGHQ